MKFLADANVSKPFVLHLQTEGHEVISVLDTNPRLRDLTILRLALDEQAIILTQDRDDRRHIIDEQRPSLGAVWIRLVKMPREERADRLITAVQSVQSGLFHTFTTIYPDRVEQYPLPHPIP